MWEVLRDTFSFKGFLKLSNFNPFTHTRPLSDPSGLFSVLLNSWVLILCMSSQVFQDCFDEFLEEIMEQEASACRYI